MGKSASGGNKKSSKADQPKRRRYVASKRGWKRRYACLQRHIAQHPNDAVAPTALPRVRQLLGL
jgi:hypothetical protein